MDKKDNDNDSDFTFCQVGVPSTEIDFDAKKLASDVSGMAIRDEYNVINNGGVVWKERLPNNGSSKKEGTVGSLSFNVIDAGSLKNPSDPARQVASSTDVGTSSTKSQEMRTSARKPAARAKVPFEKGYSQMDWLKLTQTHPDLAGLKGQSNKRLISLNEVKQHQNEGSMWTVLKGRVYNLSPYMKFHPGGVDMLMKGVGKDCTSLFNKYHAWVNAEFLLEKCLVGTLDDTQ